ncbi:7511_t:CDS:2 [Entrophospora sp. SA101]|nr:7511_t:CDS:2 [Entrophospora sp. SA101]
MSTNQGASQYFYDLFELGLEEYENYENIQFIVHNLIKFFEKSSSTLVIQSALPVEIKTCLKYGFRYEGWVEQGFTQSKHGLSS